MDLGGVRSRCRPRRSRSTSTASPSGRSSTRVAGRLARHAARRRRDTRRVLTRLERRRLHDESPARGSARRQGVGRHRVRRRAARARARRPGAAARAAPLLLEERQVGARARAPDRGRARLLGGLRVPQLRRPVAGTAVSGRLSWRLATVVVELTTETRGRRASSSIRPAGPATSRASTWTSASPPRTATRRSAATRSPRLPRTSRLALTVERLDDGEVSPYLVDELREGDELELRGPIGGYFVWQEAPAGRCCCSPAARGSCRCGRCCATAPRAGSAVPARLLYSARSLEDVIYRDELMRPRRRRGPLALTRALARGLGGHRGRVDAALLARPSGRRERPLVYICGPNGSSRRPPARSSGSGTIRGGSRRSDSELRGDEGARRKRGGRCAPRGVRRSRRRPHARSRRLPGEPAPGGARCLRDGREPSSAAGAARA